MLRSSVSIVACALVVALLALAACAPAAPPSPTAPPPKPTEAPKPAATAAPAKPAEAPAAKQADKPVASPAAKPAEKPAAAASPAAKPTEAAKPVAKVDAKALEDFYRGKTVKIIVGASAGGGYDAYSRLISRHIGRYIPGNPTLVVENMPGAGTMVAMNHVYNVAPKDGTVIGNVFGSLAILQLFGASGVQYDMAKMGYLGAPNSFSYAMFLTKRPGISKFDEILGPNGKQVVLGGIASGSGTDDGAALLREVLGANIKLVSGYPGTAQIRLAMQQGELDGVVTDWDSIKVTNRAEIDRGEWLVPMVWTEEPLKELPNAPLIGTFARNDEQRLLLRLGIIVPNRFARPYLLAPGIPAERTQALTDAFAKTMVDKEFLADAEKSKLEVVPLSGAQIQQLVQEFMSVPADIKSKLKKVLLPA